MSALFGGIEAGGTKFLCALGDEDSRVVAVSEPIQTLEPDATLGKALEFFDNQHIQSMGLACFGPVDLRAGTITTTPKIPWQHFPIASKISAKLGVPVVIDTDVNAAALGEAKFGAGRNVKSLAYITVGTGIGGGAIVDGRRVHGLMHPEMGHIRMPRHPDDEFAGSCPFHGDCWEGLASGPSLWKRWNADPRTLPDSHPAWDMEAWYLALGVVNLIFTLSPELVILGGGVMDREPLLERTRERVLSLINNYLMCPRIERAELGSMAGVRGALALAMGD
jgi:fructokinase